MFLTMLLMAICDNVRGPFVPSIKQSFNAKDSDIGILFLTCSLGYMLFTYLSGIVCCKLSHKTSVIIGIIVCILSTYKIYLSRSLSDIILSLFFLNAGEAFIVVSFNTIIPKLKTNYKAFIINLLHFFYGVGAVSTQKYTPSLLNYGFDFKTIHFLINIVMILFLIIIILIDFPITKHSNPYASNVNTSNVKIKSNKILILLYLSSLGFYTAAEFGTANWLVNFISSTYNLTEKTGTHYLSIFYFFITIGRLFGGIIADRLGYLKTSFTSLIIAFILYTLGYIMGVKGFILISFSGLFFSIVFPTLLLTINRAFKERSTYICSLSMGFSSACCMLVNLIIGYMSDLIGLYKAFYIIPICIFISCISTTFICCYVLKYEKPYSLNVSK